MTNKYWWLWQTPGRSILEGPFSGDEIWKSVKGTKNKPVSLFRGERIRWDDPYFVEHLTKWREEDDQSR